jgi:hypothetical protein
MILNWFIKQLAGVVLPLLRKQAQYVCGPSSISIGLTDIRLRITRGICSILNDLQSILTFIFTSSFLNFVPSSTVKVGNSRASVAWDMLESL